MVTSDFSMNTQPSSNTLRPIRTPCSRATTFLNGVPVSTMATAGGVISFQ